jgi:hypothetical protein
VVSNFLRFGPAVLIGEVIRYCVTGRIQRTVGLMIPPSCTIPEKRNEGCWLEPIVFYKYRFLSGRVDLVEWPRPAFD